MRIDAHDPETGRNFSGEASELDEQAITEFFNKSNLSDEEVRSWLDRLPFSADAKSYLYAIAKSTIRAGKFVIRIGRKILEIVIFLVRQFPKATFGLILGALLGFLVASIPVIGFVIGPIFQLLATIIGGVMGALEDIRDRALERKMQELAMQFQVLQTNEKK